MSPRDAADELNRKSISAATVQEWESDNGSSPNYSQLKSLAKIYKRPVAVFYFPEPPDELSTDKKFRALSKVHADQIPKQVRFLIRKGQVLQINLHELHDGVNPVASPILDDIRASPNKSAVNWAKEIRNHLGVTLETQFGWRNDDQAFKAWRRALEDHGIWVFKDTFRKDDSKSADYSGFCMPDKPFPVIYLNNGMSRNHQIFTLFHELGHLLRNKGSVDLRYTDTEEFEEPYRSEEVFCNAFAGALLVPTQSLGPDLDFHPSDEHIEVLAKRYAVSREVVWRKFLDNQRISKNVYEQKREQLNKQVKLLRKKSKQKGGGGNSNLNLRAYLGQKYLETAFQRYYQQSINEYQLADYLGIKVKRLVAMEEKMLDGSQR